MREVGIGKKEIAEKAKKNAIQLDGRLTEPSPKTEAKDETPNGGDKPKDGGK